MTKSAGGASRASRTRPQSFEQYYAANRKVGEADHSFLRGRGNVSNRAIKAQDARYKAEVKAKYDERAALRTQYDNLVAKGSTRPPSYIESLISKAQGHSDNASVQAARRLLAKKGIKFS